MMTRELALKARMAEIGAREARSPELRALAQQILGEQRARAEELRQWQEWKEQRR